MFQIDKKISATNTIITDPSQFVNKPTDTFPYTRAEKAILENLTSIISNDTVVIDGGNA